MNLWLSLYLALLFFVLTPGVLFRLPPGGHKMVVAAVHAVLFAAAYYFTNRAVWQATMNW